MVGRGQRGKIRMNKNQASILHILKVMHINHEASPMQAIKKFYDGTVIDEDLFRDYAETDDIQQAQVLIDFANWIMEMEDEDDT